MHPTSQRASGERTLAVGLDWYQTPISSDTRGLTVALSGGRVQLQPGQEVCEGNNACDSADVTRGRMVLCVFKCIAFTVAQRTGILGGQARHARRAGSDGVGRHGVGRGGRIYIKERASDGHASKAMKHGTTVKREGSCAGCVVRHAEGM